MCVLGGKECWFLRKFCARTVLNDWSLSGMWVLVKGSKIFSINPFHANCLFTYPLKNGLKAKLFFKLIMGTVVMFSKQSFYAFFFVDICKANMLSLSFLYTVWRVFKYGVFSGPYLDTFHAVLLIWFVWTYMKILAINTTIIVKFMIYATDSF